MAAETLTMHPSDWHARPSRSAQLASMHTGVVNPCADMCTKKHSMGRIGGAGLHTQLVLRAFARGRCRFEQVPEVVH